MLLEEELPGGPILKSRPSTTRFIGLPRSPEFDQAYSKLEYKNAHSSVGTLKENMMNFGGADGARTRDPRRDRPVF
jgi:hypothetical protein